MNPAAYPILIVDDDIDLCHLIAKAIGNPHIKVAIANNLREARECLESVHPKLVLLDNNLPDGLGIDFIDRIKEFDQYIKVIMITADLTARTKEIALKEGVQAFLSKPFSIEAIKNRIQAAIHPGAI